jgi:hypothetical protein
MDHITKKLISTIKTITEGGVVSPGKLTTNAGVYPMSWQNPTPEQRGQMNIDDYRRNQAKSTGQPVPPKPDRRMDDVEDARLRGAAQQAERDAEGDRSMDSVEEIRARQANPFTTPRSLPGSQSTTQQT